ncbi:hypothetical protein BDN70DRAFT_896560 [Pholiota conissans]|uniref:BTB domain-containing protein n=1 Tax=Pholiota conissans TaxID=109636 RepID=A0A9P5Z0U4_9AGAR|nr:hypothetical protein BDN70DRAFT_896560 [Pholiota conissans]
MHSTSSKSTQWVSKLFCDDDADVTFISSDDVVFKIHSEHLNLSTSTGFARDSGNTSPSSEAVHLQETAAVLNIIFQFIEPPPLSRNYKQPSIFELEPKLFFGVAEAVEKQLVEKYPLDVLNYCTLHGHTDLGDIAADLALSRPMDEIARKLTAPGLLPRFFIYYGKWARLGQASANYLFGTDCPRGALLYKMYRLQLDKNPIAVDKIPALPDRLVQCPYKSATKSSCNCRIKNSSVIIDAKKQLSKFSAINVA